MRACVRERIPSLAFQPKRTLHCPRFASGGGGGGGGGGACDVRGRCASSAAASKGKVRAGIQNVMGVAAPRVGPACVWAVCVCARARARRSSKGAAPSRARKHLLLPRPLLEGRGSASAAKKMPSAKLAGGGGGVCAPCVVYVCARARGAGRALARESVCARARAHACARQALVAVVVASCLWSVCMCVY